VNSDVIRAMKYSSHKSAAGMMGKIMARSTTAPDADFLVPVPLHKGSEREYNQAELIARGASEVWGIPVIDCVRWKIASRRQALGGGSRELPNEAMETTKNMREKRVFLIDDVCTTGNTLMAASRACERSGAPVAGAMVWSRGVSAYPRGW
jgi:predicted amidophosphoribosyltransferase